MANSIVLVSARDAAESRQTEFGKQLKPFCVTELQTVRHLDFLPSVVKAENEHNQIPGLGGWRLAIVRKNLAKFYRMKVGPYLDNETLEENAQVIAELSDDDTQAIVSFVKTFRKCHQASYTKFAKLISRGSHNLNTIIWATRWEMLHRGLADFETQAGYGVNSATRRYLGNGKWTPASCYIFWADCTDKSNPEILTLHEIPVTMGG